MRFLQTLAAAMLAGALGLRAAPPSTERHRNPTVAVLPFVNANQDAVRDGLGQSLAAMFGTHLKNETSFFVLERSQIARIVGEQGLGATGLTEAQRIQLGRMFQAEAVLTGEVSRFGTLVQMDARLVSVETGQVLVAEYASIDGYAKLRESVVAISKALEMKYLRRWMGDLVVSVQPVDAEVYLDDQYAGKATLKEPLRIPGMMEGRYALRVLAAGYGTATDTVTVVPRGVREVPVALKALPGALRITSDPVGAAVSVNGARVGVSPVVLDTLQQGRYRVSFLLDGFRPLEREVEVRSGQRSEAKGVLEVLPGRIQFGSRPEGAAVFLDDRRLGWTPLVVDNVVPGSHAFRLEMAGRSTVRDVVLVRPGEDAAAGGTLARLKGFLTAVPRVDSVTVQILGRDGAPVATVPAPFHRREMEVGDWTLRFVRPHHDTVVLAAAVRESLETRVEPELRERPARLAIGSAGEPVDVWIDGIYAGRSGRAQAVVPKGTHRVDWGGYFASGTDSVQVAPDEERRLVLPAPARPSGRWLVSLGLVLSTVLLFLAGR